MQVVIPSQLQDYTAGRTRVPAAGDSLGSVLDDLDRRYPGLRFRVVNEQGEIRQHIRFYADRTPVTSLAQSLAATSELLIVGALSGG